MTNAELRSFVEATPYVPFTLRLADGKRVPVPSPDHIFVQRHGPRAIVENDQGLLTWINLLIVVALETRVDRPDTPDPL